MLKPCRECNKAVSTAAEKCPHCGAIQMNEFQAVAYVLVMFAFLYFVVKAAFHYVQS